MTRWKYPEIQSTRCSVCFVPYGLIPVLTHLCRYGMRRSLWDSELDWQRGVEAIDEVISQMTCINDIVAELRALRGLRPESVGIPEDQLTAADYHTIGDLVSAAQTNEEDNGMVIKALGYGLTILTGDPTYAAASTLGTISDDQPESAAYLPGQFDELSVLQQGTTTAVESIAPAGDNTALLTDIRDALGNPGTKGSLIDQTSLLRGLISSTDTSTPLFNRIPILENKLEGIRGRLGTARGSVAQAVDRIEDLLLAPDDSTSTDYTLVLAQIQSTLNNILSAIGDGGQPNVRAALNTLLTIIRDPVDDAPLLTDNSVVSLLDSIRSLLQLPDGTDIASIARDIQATQQNDATTTLDQLVSIRSLLQLPDGTDIASIARDIQATQQNDATTTLDQLVSIRSLLIDSSLQTVVPLLTDGNQNTAGLLTNTATIDGRLTNAGNSVAVQNTLLLQSVADIFANLQVGITNENLRDILNAIEELDFTAAPNYSATLNTIASSLTENDNTVGYNLDQLRISLATASTAGMLSQQYLQTTALQNLLCGDTSDCGDEPPVIPPVVDCDTDGELVAVSSRLWTSTWADASGTQPSQFPQYVWEWTATEPGKAYLTIVTGQTIPQAATNMWSPFSVLVRPIRILFSPGRYALTIPYESGGGSFAYSNAGALIQFTQNQNLYLTYHGTFLPPMYNEGDFRKIIFIVPDDGKEYGFWLKSEVLQPGYPQLDNGYPIPSEGSLLLRDPFPAYICRKDL